MNVPQKKKDDFEEVEWFFQKHGEIKEICSEDEQKTNIYAIFDSEKKLLYVGQAQNIESRFKEHKKRMPTANVCRYVAVQKEEINDIEFFLISKFLPKYNKTFPPKKSFFTLDEFRSFDSRFYTNKIKVMKILKEHDVENLNGYYHIRDLHFISSKIDEVEE